MVRPRRTPDVWWANIRDDLDPWLRWGAAIVALVGIAFDMLAAYVYPWFDRIVLLKHPLPSGYVYTWRVFTLHQLASRIGNTGRFGDALTLLSVGTIVLACAGVAVVIARSNLLTRAGAFVVMVLGLTLIRWGFEIAKTPPLAPIGNVFWGTGDFTDGATEGGAACRAAVVCCALGVLLAGVGWGRAMWFRKTWLSYKGGPLEPGRSGRVVVQASKKSTFQSVGADDPRTM